MTRSPKSAACSRRRVACVGPGGLAPATHLHSELYARHVDARHELPGREAGPGAGMTKQIEIESYDRRPRQSARHALVSLAELRDAARRPEARHADLALHRHGVGGGRARLADAPRVGRLVSLFRRRGGTHRATGFGVGARLACRSEPLGRRDRPQFLLDRHRDPQSRPRFRLSGFPRRRDASGRGVVSRHLEPPRHPGRIACSPIPTWRRDGSAIPARNSIGSGWRAPASACGCRPRRSKAMSASALATKARRRRATA